MCLNTANLILILLSPLPKRGEKINALFQGLRRFFFLKILTLIGFVSWTKASGALEISVNTAKHNSTHTPEDEATGCLRNKRQADLK